MTRFLGVLILMALVITGSNAAQSGLPPLTVPDCLGVNIHFTGTEAEQVAKIADEGFRFIRMDFSWVHIEKAKGVYDFKAYDELVDSLASKGIRAYFILDYGNPLYDNDMAPHTDEGRAAFVKFAAAGAAHFKGKGVLWELWNEPNGGFWRPSSNIEDYVKLAKVVYPALKKADPDCTVLAPALAGWDYAYIEKAFKLGLLENTDVVSLHPYGAGKPEDAAVLYAKVRELIAKYAPPLASPPDKGGEKGRREYPLVSGEWGYSTFSKGVSEETQADYIARQALSNIMNQCRVTIWYDWRDDGPDPKENEHRFGTVRQNMEGKPAFFAMKTLTTALNGYTYANRIRPGSEDDCLALFRKGDDYRLAAWTIGDPHTISLPLDVGEVEIVSRSGDRSKVEVKDGKLELKLTASPQYVEPVGKSLRWAAEAAWSVDAKAEVTDKGLMLKVNSSGGGAEIGIAGAGVDKAGAQTKAGLSTPYKYSGQSKPVVTVTLKLEGMKEPLVRVIELDASTCPKLEVLPSAGRKILIDLRLPPSVCKDGFSGIVKIGNPDGIQFEQMTATVISPPGQERGLVLFEAVRQPSALFAFALKLLDSEGRTIISLPAKRYSIIESFADGKVGDVALKYAVQLDGDAKVHAEAKLTYCKAPAGAQADTCAKLDYSFDSGWKYVTIAQGLPIPIFEKPLYAKAWVKGDGGSGVGRLRIRDSGDQTFQPDFGALNFTDWRCLEADMTGKVAGHWGGKNDGKMAYPVKWDTLFLLDNVGGGETKGTIYLGPMMLCYD